METDIFNTIRRDISVVLHDAEGSSGETGDHDAPEPDSPCASSDGDTGYGRDGGGTSADADAASGRLEEPRPARIRSMSMRTKIDADYHMREAVSQIGRMRRHTVDCSGMRSPASPLTSVASLNGLNSPDSSVDSAVDRSDVLGDRADACASSEKYRVAPLPNAITM